MERPPLPRRFPAHRRLRQRRGVAAAIGTLLALLVFMSLFGLFVTQFVPLWMTDNEASFTATVQGQFGTIKQNLDLLALDGGNVRSLAAAVTMESGNIPVMAQATQGVLAYQSSLSLYTNISFNLTGVSLPRTSHAQDFYQNFTPGEISMDIPNRYYVPTTFSLSNGAVVSQQSGGSSSMLFAPSFQAITVGTSTTLYLTLYEMLGNGTRLTSTGTEEVYTAYAATQSYPGATNTSVDLNFTTPYPCAWIHYLNSTFKASGVVPALTPSACPTSLGVGQVSRVSVAFPPVHQFVLTMVSFDVTLGFGTPG